MYSAISAPGFPAKIDIQKTKVKIVIGKKEKRFCGLHGIILRFPRAHGPSVYHGDTRTNFGMLRALVDVSLRSLNIHFILKMNVIMNVNVDVMRFIIWMFWIAEQPHS